MDSLLLLVSSHIVCQNDYLPVENIEKSANLTTVGKMWELTKSHESVREIYLVRIADLTFGFTPWLADDCLLL